MNRSIHINHDQKNQTMRAIASWMMLGLVCMGLLLLQSSPMSANHSGTDWIEICGSNGAEMIPVDSDSPALPSDCAHCSYCLVQSQGSHGNVPSFKTQLRNPRIAKIEFSLAAVRIVNNPEHYWSQSRGPPKRNEYNKMISVTCTIPPIFSTHPNNLLGAL